MINGILKIKGLGVYENYTRPHDTHEFAVKNLIYGWNYSGKTTLSRLFAQLESKTANPDLSGCSFSFDTDKGLVTEANFTQSDLTIRVFNSDFVRDNLSFTGGDFKPVLLLGKESEEAQKKLDHCEELDKRLQERVKGYAASAQKLQTDFAAAKTKTAAEIKKTLGLVQAYTATHLGQDIVTIEFLEDSKLLAEVQLRDDLKLALTPDTDRPASVDLLSASPSIEPLFKDAITVMAATPSLASTIDHLVQNPLIERWVEAGLTLHEEKEKCEFCGGDVGKHRLEVLQAHFSKDLADHKAKIEGLLTKVRQAQVSIQLPKEAEFNPQFRERFRESSSHLPQALKAFNQAVSTLAADLQKKIETPFKAQEPISLADGLANSVMEAIKAINEVIVANNQIAENFITAKKDAINRVRLHYVQEFLEKQDKAGQEHTMARLGVKQSRLNRLGTVVQAEIQRLKAVISQAQLGREEINKRLSSLLGSEAVQINVVSVGGQERFQLVRKSGKVAKNLSDGEKTAIAFAYFLTKLEEFKPEQFKEAIVYIDDPISSLDSNHIFQITAAIKSFFLGQDENGAWTTKCKQLFISTHNFEFFHLMRELEPKKPSRAKLYLVKRVNGQASTLGNMPNSLARYSSEYHFLFQVIHRFHTAPDKTDHEVLMLLPNAVRRFVELYTYSRLPGVFKESVDQRTEELFGEERAKRILKVFHYFSHANSIDRLAGNNELIFDTENAVRDLLEAINEKDEGHMKALLASIS